MKIKAIKIVFFILIFCILLYSVSKVLRFKHSNGLYQTYMFYKQPKNSIDVLFIGSSHVHFDINPAILYKEYGIASYNFSTASQTLLNSYFYLKEALKTQKPKLIVLEGYILSAYDYTGYRDYHFISGIFGINFSLNKINLIKSQIQKNRWHEFFNPFYQYHNRYSSLSRLDFVQYDYFNFFKGVSLAYGSNNIKSSTFSEKRESLTDIVEKYYRKFILLAKENNIPILVIISPYSLSNDDSKKFNTAKDIADEYDIPFIDFNLNYDDYNLDFSKDLNDANHLNYIGATKFSKHLAKYLKDNYDLPDRRGDPKYYSWEMNAKFEYKKTYNFELKESSNLNEYIEKVKNAEDYIIGITMLGNYQNNDVAVQDIATNFNINYIYLTNASYVIDNNKLIYSSSGSNEYLFYDEIGNYTDLVVDSGRKLSINRTNYTKTTNGINMVIYDKFTEEIVDNIYLEYKDDSITPTIKR